MLALDPTSGRKRVGAAGSWRRHRRSAAKLGAPRAIDPRSDPVDAAAGGREPLPTTAPLWYVPGVLRASARAAADGGSSNGRTADSDSASLGSNPSPPASLSRSIRWSERAGGARQKTPRFAGLCGTAGLVAPVERGQAGARASDAAEFLCRALMHWRNSADAHRPRSRVPADRAAPRRTAPAGPWQ
jgi:hypothetical protein